jgi:hypothetical protein
MNKPSAKERDRPVNTAFPLRSATVAGPATWAVLIFVIPTLSPT